MMSRRDLLAAAAATGLTTAVPARSVAGATSADVLKSVDPFIGTGGHGHTFPGATVPFGMVQLSPDTDNARWDACSGYYHDDKTLLGFSHTHLSGTGAGDMLDLLVVPFTGEVRLKPGTLEEPDGSYRTRMDHSTEIASPGYYSLVLPETGIHCELTATSRVGLHRYTFPDHTQMRLLLDWRHGAQVDEATPCQVRDACLRLIDKNTVIGSRRVEQWAGGRTIHFCMKLSRPLIEAQFYNNDQPVPATDRDVTGAALKCVLTFGISSGSEPLLVKVGLSAVSPENALANLASDLADFDFERVRHTAETAWRSELSRIRIETSDDTDRTIFYTSLYHAYMAPTLFSDADGRYRSMDSTIQRLAPGEGNYSTYSLWDTYRAWHPLMTLIAPERAAVLARNLIRMAQESADGPCVWPLQGVETHCMIAWHSAVVITEALQKHLPGVDAKKAWPIYRQLAFERSAAGQVAYRKMGYVPCDLESQSVSKTLEYAYDDWAMAHMATAAGDYEASTKLMERSQSYKNVFDSNIQFTRPRMKDGSWAVPFAPNAMGHNSAIWWDFTESNAWQATFLNQHDIYRYIELFGGEAAFEAKLDSLFAAPSELPPEAPPDMSGLIGQYVHGNEPSHHIAYLYAYCGAHYKTQARVRNLLKTQYRALPNGLSGNEDCGQMSAWYILSAIGFYPVDPISCVYVFGSPLFSKVEIPLGGGRSLLISAPRVSDENFYIQSVTWKGRLYRKSWISHREIVQGGELIFEMGPTPNKAFGVDHADRPPSFTVV